MTAEINEWDIAAGLYVYQKIQYDVTLGADTPRRAPSPDNRQLFALASAHSFYKPRQDIRSSPVVLSIAFKDSRRYLMLMTSPQRVESDSGHSRDISAWL